MCENNSKQPSVATHRNVRLEIQAPISGDRVPENN